jgi:hypothetical protein
VVSTMAMPNMRTSLSDVTRSKLRVEKKKRIIFSMKEFYVVSYEKVKNAKLKLNEVILKKKIIQSILLLA